MHGTVVSFGSHLHTRKHASTHTRKLVCASARLTRSLTSSMTISTVMSQMMISSNLDACLFCAKWRVRRQKDLVNACARTH